MKLRNEYKKLAITLAVLASCTSAVFAADNAFTPLNFDDNYTPPTAAATKAPAVKKVADTSKAAKAADSAAVDKNGEVPIGNGNIQNAILELDNAQVGIRNDLLNYKAKYSDVDAQYKLIKNERNMLNKQVRSIEKRIRDIDKAKEKIRRNML